ncbi:MAG: sigma-54-dependent Fis family transcriptional regulator [Candidatus Anammoximicrobium sp.]|nr:sigma-54-dependent Fis family transcriptional regulator [Candidatus Anammoximicrobium sp.]
MPTLLAIDDERLILDCFRYTFTDPEIKLVTAVTGSEGLTRFQESQPDAVITDIRLPDMSGIEVLQQFREWDPKVPVILITGHGTAETAIEAMRLGAYDYLLKPLDPERLAELVRRALEMSRLMRVPAKVPDEAAADDRADVLVGRCPAMQEVFKAIGRVAPQNVTVLILGESGTGKELVARAIYNYSRRAEGKFLAVNCAAIPETLLESELLGHERGAFTGADRRRIGKFEQCHGGTLFLDEIGDLTPLTQSKILRVLQDQRFQRIGGSEMIATDVRLLAATNRDLEQMMKTGQLRSDLYYRLNVFTIRLPPLRERGDDLTLLVQYLLRRDSRDMGKQVDQVAPEAWELMRRYSWPGNVRELQSAVKQAIVRATGPVLMAEFLPDAVRSAGATAAAAVAEPAEWQSADLNRWIAGRLQAGASGLYNELISTIERQLLLETLRHTGQNRSEAARILGISRSTLRLKLAALGLDAEPRASEDDE